TLQLAVAFGDEQIDAIAGRRRRFLVFGNRLRLGSQLLFALVAGGEPIGQRARLVRQGLLEAEDFVAALTDVPVRLGRSGVCLLARLERRFLTEGLRVSFGLPDDSIGF